MEVDSTRRGRRGAGGTGVRLRPGAAGPIGGGAGEGAGHRPGRLLPELRGRPRGPLLSHRVAQGPLCVDGRRALYPFLESRQVAYRKCGKLVVATQEGDVERLEAIRRQAEINGVEGIAMMSGAQAIALEPQPERRGGADLP